MPRLVDSLLFVEECARCIMQERMLYHWHALGGLLRLPARGSNALSSGRVATCVCACSCVCAVQIGSIWAVDKEFPPPPQKREVPALDESQFDISDGDEAEEALQAARAALAQQHIEASSDRQTPRGPFCAFVVSACVCVCVCVLSLIHI